MTETVAPLRALERSDTRLDPQAMTIRPVNNCCPVTVKVCGFHPFEFEREIAVAVGSLDCFLVFIPLRIIEY